jgi:hypothetical protein
MNIKDDVEETWTKSNYFEKWCKRALICTPIATPIKEIWLEM